MAILLLPWILLVVLFAITYFVIKQKWSLIIIFALVLFYANWHYEVLPLSFRPADSSNSLKVLTFNIQGSIKDSISIKGIEQIILREKPDIVFVVEDIRHILYENLGELTYIYPFVTNSYKDGGHYLLSKFPIKNAERIEKEKHSLLYHYTIIFNNDSIHLYGCHLASNNYTKERKYMHPDSIQEINGVKMYLNNIKRASNKRVEEVQKFLADVNPKNRNIILGDFNDISGSKPLNMIEDAGFNDAWWKGGFGYGATIHYPLPYRIDHIFYNDKLKLKSIKKINPTTSSGTRLSDHDALVASFSIKQ